MRKAWFLLLLSCGAPPRGCAQQTRYLEIPRYEVGVQFDFNYLSHVGEWGGGFGARFHYNFNEHLGLDSQVTYRQHDISSVCGTSIRSGVIGQTSGLFGLRAGQRVRDAGLFAEARAGFLHFSRDNGASLLTRDTVPAFDVGGTLEHYAGPMVLRLDLSELIVAYGNAKVSPGPPVLPPQPPPGRLGTRAAPMVGFGLAVRF